MKEMNIVLVVLAGALIVGVGWYIYRTERERGELRQALDLPGITDRSILDRSSVQSLVSIASNNAEAVANVPVSNVSAEFAESSE